MIKQILESAGGFVRRLDKILILLCVAACCFSVVLLISLYHNHISSKVTARQYEMQAAMSFAGLVLALIIAAVPYRYIAKFWYIHLGGTLMLTLLLFTGLGVRAEGADDLGWLNLGFIQIQPSEFFKISFIVTFALHLSKVREHMNTIPNMLLLCAHGAFPVLLIAVQGDDGQALVFLFIFLTMMFVAGVAWYWITAALVAAPAGIWVVWNYIMQPHHKKRILVLLDPVLQEAEIPNIFNQQYNGLIALGTGGMSGLGLSGGSYHYVAVLQSDFIFSYIGMTIGFIGCVATVGLLMLLCLKVLFTGHTAKDWLGKLICFGVFALYFFHSLINIGMVLAVMPVVGIPLPFISAGGSTTLSMFAAAGLVLSVNAHREQEYRLFKSG